MLTLAATAISRQTRAIEPTHGLAFCLALRLMAKEGVSVLNRPRPDVSELWNSVMKMMLRCLFAHHQSPSEAFDTFTTCDSAMFLQKHVRALTAVGIFSIFLRMTIECGGIRRLAYALPSTAVIAVPTSADIPLHLMLDVPLPFTSSASMEILSCHLPKMTTVDFLEDGEWAGFYGISYAPSTGRHEPLCFDPPMHGIHFVATAQHGDPTILSLQGSGEDAIGAFDLEGKLASKTGNINMRKTYSGGSPAWDWVCIMTPVGIVGSWGQEDFGGWIWLWKTGWTANQ